MTYNLGMKTSKAAQIGRVLVIAMAIALWVTPAGASDGVSSPLEIQVSTTRTDVTVGSEVTWHVLLTPAGEWDGGEVELRPADPAAWAWPAGPPPVTVRDRPVTLTLTAIPNLELQLGLFDIPGIYRNIHSADI